MHWYRKNIGDYSKKAGRLSMLEHGSYNLLIDACYDRERFPTEEEAIDWTWASSPEEEQAVRFVLKKFFTLQPDGTYVQKRIAEEIADYLVKAEKNRIIALYREYKKKMMRIKKRPIEFEEFAKQHEPCEEPHEPCTNRDRTEANDQPNQYPVTSNQYPVETKKPDQSELDHCFDLFWNAGMRKVSKKKAKPLFIKHLLRNCDSEGPTIYDLTNTLVTDIKKRIEVDQLGFGEMHPTTYLNGDRWEDEIPEKKHEANNRCANPRPESNHARVMRQSIEAAGIEPREILDPNGDQVSAEVDFTVPRRHDPEIIEGRVVRRVK